MALLEQHSAVSSHPLAGGWKLMTSKQLDLRRPLASVPHKRLSFPAGAVLHPVTGQVKHKGAAEDPGGREDEEGDPQVPGVQKSLAGLTS